jgi:hypothetical protein
MNNPTVYLVTVHANALPFDEVIWACFKSDEDACKYVESNVARGLMDRVDQEEPIYLLKGSFSTWLGYTADSEKNLLVYAGIRVAVTGALMTYSRGDT